MYRAARSWHQMRDIGLSATLKRASQHLSRTMKRQCKATGSHEDGRRYLARRGRLEDERSAHDFW